MGGPRTSDPSEGTGERILEERLVLMHKGIEMVLLDWHMDLGSDLLREKSYDWRELVGINKDLDQVKSCLFYFQITNIQTIILVLFYLNTF